MNLEAPSNFTFSLKCWNCGQTSKDLKTNERISSSIHLIKAAKFINWLCVYDFNRNRSLIFCSKNCKNNAKTKKGYFRKYPLRKN